MSIQAASVAIPDVTIEQVERCSTASQAVSLVVEYCKKHADISVRAAAKLLKPQLSGLSSDERWELIVWGICYLSTSQLTGSSKRRGIGNNNHPEDSSAVPSISILLTSFYLSSEGLRKPLIEFTIEDLVFFKKERLQEALGLKKRIDAAEFSKGLLIKHDVKKIGDLPPIPLQNVEDVWGQILA
jgi:hypothetical protein